MSGESMQGMSHAQMRDYILRELLPVLRNIAAGRKIKAGDPSDPTRQIDVLPPLANRLWAAGVLEQIDVMVGAGIYRIDTESGLIRSN